MGISTPYMGLLTIPYHVSQLNQSCRMPYFRQNTEVQAQVSTIPLTGRSPVRRHGMIKASTKTKKKHCVAGFFPWQLF